MATNWKTYQSGAKSVSQKRCHYNLDHNLPNADIPYGAETWSPTRQLARNLDAFDSGMSVPYIMHFLVGRISHEEVRRRPDQPPLTHITHTTRLKFFGDTACADPSMDHS